MTKIGLCLLALAAGVAGGWYVWYGRTTQDPSPVVQADPPRSLAEVNLKGVDPAVVKFIRPLLEAAQQSPDTADAWGQLGMALLAHGFSEPSAHCFTHAADLDPDEPSWPYLHATAIVLTAPQEAASLLERAADLAGDDPSAPRLRSIELLLQLDRLDEAHSHLSKFLTRHPTDPRALQAQGRLEFLRGDYEGCLITLQGLSSHPAAQHSSALIMAEAYFRLGQSGRAQTKRQAALQLSQELWADPYSEEVRGLRTGLKSQLNRADLMFGRGEVEASAKLLRETIREYPDSAWAKVLLGRALIRARHLDEAETVLREALQLAPQSVEAHFRLGVALLYKKRPRAAVQCYRKAVSIKPDFTMAYYNLGYSLQVLDDLSGAIDAYKKAIQCQPDLSMAYAALGGALLRQGNRDEARKHLQRAVALDPSDTTSRQVLQRLSSGASR